MDRPSTPVRFLVRLFGKEIGSARVPLWALLAVSLLLALGLSLALRNDSECRAHGFSRVYCATTHFIR